MNKYNLIDTFFNDQNDYIVFLTTKNQRVIANQDGTCFAELKKENGYFLYKLIWIKDGRFVGDYVSSFTPIVENINTFNKGCKIIAKRLTIYLDTNDINAIPSIPPAFGELTHYI